MTLIEGLIPPLADRNRVKQPYRNRVKQPYNLKRNSNLNKMVIFSMFLDQNQLNLALTLSLKAVKEIY